MISLAQKFQIAEGNATTFSDRVLAQLHREAIFRINGGASGQDRIACLAIYANVTNFRFPITFALLNDQFVGVDSLPALDVVPDLGVSSIEAAVGAQWATFVSALFPASV